MGDLEIVLEIAIFLVLCWAGHTNNSKVVSNSFYQMELLEVFSNMKNASSKVSPIQSKDIFILLRLSWAKLWCLPFWTQAQLFSKRANAAHAQSVRILSAQFCVLHLINILRQSQNMTMGYIQLQNAIIFFLVYNVRSQVAHPRFSAGSQSELLKCGKHAQRPDRRRHISHLQEDAIRFWGPILPGHNCVFEDGGGPIG